MEYNTNKNDVERETTIFIEKKHKPKNKLHKLNLQLVEITKKINFIQQYEALINLDNSTNNIISNITDELEVLLLNLDKNIINNALIANKNTHKHEYIF